MLGRPKPSTLVIGACAAALLVSAGCANLSRPPREIVEPVVTGIWRSSEPVEGGRVRITLQGGESITVDEEKARLRVGVPAAKDGALVLYGNRPMEWYILAPLAVPLDGMAAGCHVDSGPLLYDEPETVVMRLQTAAGDWASFGIRLKKGPAAQIQAPLPENSGFYGFRSTVCLDDRGAVTYIGP